MCGPICVLGVESPEEGHAHDCDLQYEPCFDEDCVIFQAECGQ